MSLTEQVSMAGTIVAAVTAVFTGIAAAAAWWSASTTRRAAEAATCLRFFERYESDRMLGALRTLRTSKPLDVDVNQWAAQWTTVLQGNPPQWAKDVDLARREVTGYFFSLIRLYEGGLVTRNFVWSAGYFAGINLFYDVCEPLERALNPRGYPERPFRLLEKIVGRYKAEAGMRPERRLSLFE